MTATVDNTTTPDEAAVEAFEERIVNALNDAATSLMVSVGHRTGLFDAMAAGGSMTIDELAARSGCDRRYVQEWLGAMTVADVVTFDAAAATYRLPPAHARLLTRANPIENLAVFAQYIAMMGAVEDDVVECFLNGGGVAYDRFPRFQEIMAEDSGQSVLPALADHILPLVDGLVARLDAGIRVLDVGCGRGRAVLHLAAAHPASTFVGVDLSDEAIGHARETAADAGLDNVTFEVGDAARLAESVPADTIDLATTFDAVHDQADPAAMLAGIHHALAPDGVYLAQDIDATSTHDGDRDHPLGPLLYTLSTMHCMTVSLARGGTGLGAMWGRQRALDHFHGAGFASVAVHTLDHDPQNAYYVCRP